MRGSILVLLFVAVTPPANAQWRMVEEEGYLIPQVSSGMWKVYFTPPEAIFDDLPGDGMCTASASSVSGDSSLAEVYLQKSAVRTFGMKIHGPWEHTEPMFGGDFSIRVHPSVKLWKDGRQIYESSFTYAYHIYHTSFWDLDEYEPFSEMWATADTMTYEAGPHSATFDLTGSRGALQYLHECFEREWR